MSNLSDLHALSHRAAVAGSDDPSAIEERARGHDPSCLPPLSGVPDDGLDPLTGFEPLGLARAPAPAARPTAQPDPLRNPILQFGTSRRLLAHAALFVDEALEDGQALGQITVVHGGANGTAPGRDRRAAGLAGRNGYAVRIRGRKNGALVVNRRRVTSISAALDVHADWPAILAAAAGAAQVIMSDTDEQGYVLADEDGRQLLDSGVAPRSFPAQLLVLLHARYRAGAAPITLYPCDPGPGTDTAGSGLANGTALRDLVLALARSWTLDSAFIDYLLTRCAWINSMVDRMVVASADAAAADAEPYAIWAVEAQPGMVLPCTHPQLVVTDRLASYARRKQFLLDLGRCYLAELWLRQGRHSDETVWQAMSESTLRAELEAVWNDEVLPLLDLLGEGAVSRDYLVQVRERLANPFLEQRLADLAQEHDLAKRRWLWPVVELAGQLGLPLAQNRLRTALGLSNGNGAAA